jgi:hypothetical protein
MHHFGIKIFKKLQTFYTPYNAKNTMGLQNSIVKRALANELF